MSISFKVKVLLQDLKKCKHWFSYCSKVILNDYTKEICAKQVANQSDFLKAFLHLEPLLPPVLFPSLAVLRGHDRCENTHNKNRSKRQETEANHGKSVICQTAMTQISQCNRAV